MEAFFSIYPPPHPYLLAILYPSPQVFFLSFLPSFLSLHLSSFFVLFDFSSSSSLFQQQGTSLFGWYFCTPSNLEGYFSLIVSPSYIEEIYFALLLIVLTLALTRESQSPCLLLALDHTVLYVLHILGVLPYPRCVSFHMLAVQTAKVSSRPRRWTSSPCRRMAGRTSSTYAYTLYTLYKWLRWCNLM